MFKSCHPDTLPLPRRSIAPHPDRRPHTIETDRQAHPVSTPPRDSAPQPAVRLRAIAAMCGASVLLSLMGVCTKLATQTGRGSLPLPAGEIALVRYTCGILFLLLLSRSRPVALFGRNRVGLLWRGVAGSVASTAFFIGIQTTSLTHATLLNYTNVVWASLFAIFVLHERLRPSGAAAILAALTGVALVTNPAVNAINIGDLVSLFSGVMAGIAVVQIRKLRRTESARSVFFYFNLVGLPVAAAAMLVTRTPLVPPSLSQWTVLAGVGAASVGGQLLMTFGYRDLPAAQGSLIILTSVILSALLSHLLFHDPWTANTLLGGLLILGGAIWLSRPTAAKPRMPMR